MDALVPQRTWMSESDRITLPNYNDSATTRQNEKKQ